MLVHDLLKRGNDSDDAVYSQLGALTYLGLKVAVENSRRRLYAQGVRRNQCVAIYSRNRAEYIAAFMAIVSLGAIAVPLHFQLSAREVAAMLQDADCRFLLTDRELALDVALAARGVPAVRQIVLAALIEPTTLPPPLALAKAFGADETAALFYTPGTDGTPWGVMLSHRNLVMNAIDVQQAVGLRRADNIFCALPLDHPFGWTCAVMGALYVGATISVLDTVTPQKTIDVARVLGVTVIVLGPSLLPLITRLAQPADMKSLRFVLSGEEPLEPESGEAFRQKFGVPVVEGYGLPEASPVVTMNDPQATRSGSVGTAIPDVRVRVAKPDGSGASDGEAGDLLVQGPNVMHGYWRKPEATAAALADGWLHTGVTARREADGYVYILGRRGENLVNMGERISPREIETVIGAYPGVAEAAVVAVEAASRGKVLSCFYTVEEDGFVDPQRLKKYLQKKLALFKIPRAFYELEKIPRTAAGHIDREALSATPEGKSE